MGRDWFRSPKAVAYTAPLILCSQVLSALASQPEPALSGASKIVAAAPGDALAPIGVFQGASTLESTATERVRSDTETNTTTDTSEELVPVGDLPAEEMQEEDGMPPGEPEEVPPLLPVGDDELPGEQEIENNPYLIPLQMEGMFGRKPGDNAYVPPVQKQAQDNKVREGATEMMEILGEETYNRRVNITTPPDTEVAEVIRLLAERAQLNFVYAEGIIKGRVTLNLRDVPLGVALQSLLSTHALSIVREGENVMRIVQRKEVKPGQVELKTIFVRLNWIPAASLTAALQNLGGSSQGAGVKFHKESNTVIITDTPPNVALMRDLVQQLDVPQKQVMIEARMVELLINNGRTLGSRIRAERRDSSGNSGVLGELSGSGPRTEVDRTVTIDPITKEPVVSETSRDIPAQVVDVVESTLLAGNNAPSFAFGGVVSILGSQFDVSGALNGLETRNVANVLANPRVITLDNQEAVIDIKRDNPYLEAQQGVTQGAVTASVKFKESGVRLAVLPTITNNGFVRMRLEPEQLILAGVFSSPNGDIPIIDKRSAVTNVIVKDEDTVVLGGLREIDSNQSKSMTPWLGQVPVFGHFFKRSGKGFFKNDLMLFVTPHIVKAPVMTPAENYKFSRVDAHWDLPDFFFDDSVEQRENRHRGELDANASGYVPQTLKLPPPVPSLDEVDGVVGEDEAAEEGSEK